MVDDPENQLTAPNYRRDDSEDSASQRENPAEKSSMSFEEFLELEPREGTMRIQLSSGEVLEAPLRPKKQSPVETAPRVMQDAADRGPTDQQRELAMNDLLLCPVGEPENIRVWRPDSSEIPTAALVVRFSGHPQEMTPQKYRELFESRLAELIEEDPKQAGRLLEASPEHSPNLYEIATNYPPKHWPIQIVMSDQMQILLNKIDWGSAGVCESVDELPAISDIIEAL